MSEYFEKHSALFDAELRRQVDLLWPREAERIEAHGLREAKSVLDLGTGNGYFLYRLAARHPRKRFMGVESSPSLAGVAKRWETEGKRPNMRVLEGACPLAGVKRKFDLVLARLSLYSMPNRQAVLRWARGRLNKGGRIVIVDVDDALKTCWPPGEFWEPMVSAMSKDIGPGADRFLARKLPQLLLKAGFRDVRFELQPWYSSIDLGAADFKKFWTANAREMAQARPDLLGPAKLAKFLRSIAEVAGSTDKVALTFECVVSAGK